MYSAIEISKYIIDYCFEKQKPISNLKLQKILYFLWIDYYKEKQTELFLDNFCAWQFGPVVPDVYYAFCQYAGYSICETFSTHIKEYDVDTINNIISRYIDTPVNELVERTHRPNGAWDLTYKSGKGSRNPISFDLIKSTES